MISSQSPSDCQAHENIFSRPSHISLLTCVSSPISRPSPFRWNNLHGVKMFGAIWCVLRSTLWDLYRIYVREWLGDFSLYAVGIMHAICACVLRKRDIARRLAYTWRLDFIQLSRDVMAQVSLVRLQPMKFGVGVISMSRAFGDYMKAGKEFWMTWGLWGYYEIWRLSIQPV